MAQTKSSVFHAPDSYNAAQDLTINFTVTTDVMVVMEGDIA